MDLLAFKIERDVEAGVLVASWDDPEGGGITTQAKDLTELAEAIKESVRCHFAGRSRVDRCFESHIHAPVGGVALIIGFRNGTGVGVGAVAAGAVFCEAGAVAGCFDVPPARSRSTRCFKGVSQPR